jgi:hypothetical protein
VNVRECYGGGTGETRRHGTHRVSNLASIWRLRSVANESTGVEREPGEQRRSTFPRRMKQIRSALGDWWENARVGDHPTGNLPSKACFMAVDDATARGSLLHGEVVQALGQDDLERPAIASLAEQRDELRLLGRALASPGPTNTAANPSRSRSPKTWSMWRCVPLGRRSGWRSFVARAPRRPEPG